ncbi:MAG: hypothetical protein Q7T20_11005 [Saprospiraceae bacterium]|nr:hypothetical protein [Saprospiraceae bacterium]
MQKEKLAALASERSTPCVSISMGTHRTHPANAQDVIGLKKLVNEAKERVITEFGKRPVSELLDKLENIEKEVDVNYNLESLHVFLSNETQEIIRSPWPVQHNSVQVAESFAVKPLIKLFNRSEEYMILLLSQSGVKLFVALNDGIVQEVKNEDFPFGQNPHYLTNTEKMSDGKQVDNMVREYLNSVDKALQSVHRENGMYCVVVCTEDNYSRLMQVTDKASTYYGHVSINYNDTANHTIAAQAWALIKTRQQERRSEAIQEMQEAVSQGKVLTDLSEIYKAAKEGRGDLLITHQDYSQAVKMTGEFSFELADETTAPDVTDDIVSNIAWEIILKKGRAIFTEQAELDALGKIALKVRY